MCNCNKCKHQEPSQEYELAIDNEYFSNETSWSSIPETVKSYISPFFNWLTGSPTSSPVAPAPSIPATPIKPSTPVSTGSSEQQLVANAIANGERSENNLTNLIFYKRYPSLNGKALSSSMPNFSALSKEWVNIRDSIVKPALNSRTSIPVTIPGTVTGSGRLTLQNIMNAMIRKNHVIYQEPYRLNIVGVRANNPKPNSFDDTINLFYTDNSGNWKFLINRATTDPGLYYLNNPMNVSGTAIVIPGQYINSHKIGLHRGQYTALVQQGPIRVTRDTNKDNVLDFKNGNEVTGVFGINIHRSSSTSTSKSVDKWSAGCQVFADSKEFANFISLCQQHSKLYGNNFTYTLLEEGDLDPM